jgi:hypothetical protein
MKLTPSRMVAATLLLVAHSTFAQNITDNYDFFYPKIKFSPAYPAPEGTTFKLTHVQKTERLSAKNLDAMSTLINIDLKYNRKTPDVTFFFNVTGITIKNQETISADGKLFKKINYTIKNSIDCIDKAGATFNSLPLENGTKVKSIIVGANFFRQLVSDNDKYPKPADVPNIDASPGYVPSFEEAFGKIPPIGFSTQTDLDAFEKKYTDFIVAKAEAIAVQTEFSNSVDLLMVLYGSGTWRENFAVAAVGRAKSNPNDYSDMDKAAEQIKNAYKILSVNVADTAAYYPLLRSAVNTYTAIEASKEDRLKSEVAQSILQHNLSLAHAWLLNMDEAIKYAGKLSANKRAAPGPILSIQRTIAFLQKRAITKEVSSPGNLLEKMPKS